MKVQNERTCVREQGLQFKKIFLILLRLIDKTRNEKNRRNFHLALQVERGGPGTLVRPGSPSWLPPQAHPPSTSLGPLLVDRVTHILEASKYIGFSKTLHHEHSWGAREGRPRHIRGFSLPPGEAEGVLRK